MPFYTKNDVCLFHSHVPKTGGTSVRNFFESNGFKVEFNERLGALSQQHKEKTDKELLEEISKRNPVFSFVFIRDPLERIFSEFRYGHHWGKNKTNEDFDEYIIIHLKNLEKSPFQCDNHLRRQIEYVHENMNVYKFGDWDKMITDVSKVFPLENKNFLVSNKSKEYEWLPSTKETLDFIKEVYKEDFELFNSIK
jgi:hypothetical protein